MTLSSGGAPLGGRSALGSKTVWSGLLAILAFYLPTVLTWLGVPVASQPNIIALINQAGPPIFSLLAIIFRINATRQITAILPGKARPMAMRVLPWMLIAPLVIMSTMSLGACATTALTPAQAAEETDIGANLSYVVIAKGVNVFVALPTTSPAAAAAAQADKVKAWGVLGDIRAAYAASQPLTALIAQLAQIQLQASTDTNGKVAPPNTPAASAQLKAIAKGSR